MTTVRKPDGTETTSLHETAKVILEYLLIQENGEDNPHHKTIRWAIDDDAVYPRRIKKQNRDFQLQESSRTRWHQSRIYLRVFNIFLRIITTIYNQCLKQGYFPKWWKIAKVIRAKKTGKRKEHRSVQIPPNKIIKCGRQNTRPATYQQNKLSLTQK